MQHRLHRQQPLHGTISLYSQGLVLRLPCPCHAVSQWCSPPSSPYLFANALILINLRNCCGLARRMLFARGEASILH
jgi:hypothetical protein